MKTRINIYNIIIVIYIIQFKQLISKGDIQYKKDLLLYHIKKEYKINIISCIMKLELNILYIKLTKK